MVVYCIIYHNSVKDNQ